MLSAMLGPCGAGPHLMRCAGRGVAAVAAGAASRCRGVAWVPIRPGRCRRNGSSMVFPPRRRMGSGDTPWGHGTATGDHPSGHARGAQPDHSGDLDRTTRDAPRAGGGGGGADRHRSALEYASAHIPGAISVGEKEEEHITPAYPDKGTLIVL